MRYRASLAPFADDSPTIIHLHGFAISGTYLLPTSNILAGEFRNLVPDLPGFGRSMHPSKVLSIPELAMALFDFMDEVGVGRATLVGNSMGCITALEAARIDPDRVERIVLVSPAGGPFNRPIFRGVFQLARDGLREPPALLLIAAPDYLRYGMINAARLFWEMIHYPTVERFRDVRVPTLVIMGERDPLISERRIVSGTSNNPMIAVVRIDGAAHAINYSHPAMLAHLIRDFMKGGVLSDKPGARGTAVILRQAIHSGEAPSR